MKRPAKLDHRTVYRFKKLGDVGEGLTQSLLVRNGFDDVRNLNLLRSNFLFADVLAERDGVRYVISVKMRNKYEFARDGSRRLNSRYELGSKCYEHAEIAEKEFNAKAAWLTIKLDSKTYSAYFGLLSLLNASRGVKMSEKAIAGYERLAKDERHDFNHDELKNVYEIAE